MFCQIVGGAIPSSQVIDTGTVLAFMDTDPVTPGHVQDVFHSHLHVFPRWPGDGFVINANSGTNPARDDLDAAASKIAAALNLT